MNLRGAAHLCVRKERFALRDARFCVLRASGPTPLAQQHHAHYRARPAMPARLAPRRHPPVLVVLLSSTVQREVESPALYHRAFLRGAASTMEPPAPMQVPVPLPRTMRAWLCSVLAPGTCCRARSVALGTHLCTAALAVRAPVLRASFAPSGHHLLRPSSVATPLSTVPHSLVGPWWSPVGSFRRQKVWESQ